MVKVQKPQPKSLNKSASIEGVVKKKGKPEKTKKLATDATLELASNKKAKNAAPVKKDAIKKETEVSKKGAEKKQSKAAKRPLILAPPESPAAPPPAAKKSKAKSAASGASDGKKIEAKKPLILAPPESPVPPKKQVKKTKAAPVEAKKEQAPAKKSVQDPVPSIKKVPAAKKSGQTAVQTKKTAKPEKPGKQAAPAKPAKAQPASQLQKKAKAVQKLSKPANAPKSKKPLGKSKPGQAKDNAVNKEPAKSKKPVELTFELKSFDEKRFHEIVNENNVTKVCEALKSVVSKEVEKKKNTSIFSDYRYILQVCSYKIASCPKRMVKLNLQHSLVGKDDDVALIVPDLQRGAKFDYDPTKQHYEDMLREAGVKQRLTIVPFNQLRNEMGSFEAKRKFLNSYDYLLCDGRLSGQATAFLGKNTQKPRNVLHSLRLSKDNDKLPQEVTRALTRTAFRQLSKGDLTAVPVGNHEMTAKQLAENILLVIKQLQEVYPGGLANIRSLYLKIDITGTSALPLYVSMCAPPEDVPYVVGPREQRMLKLKKQANEVLSKFAMTKDAEFIKLTSDQVKRKAQLRKEKAALLAADAAPKDNDGEDTAVPTKKARKDSGSEGAKAESESDEEEEVQEAEDSAGESGDEDEEGDDGDDTDEDDDDDNEDGDDDDEDEDDDEEDDDEEEDYDDDDDEE
ncbi:ribosomal L1 domain-containing protein CG13096 [Drosophila sechellia]|uniref:GM12858 n=1 Tax=Drosophila sechellia TaxID=7238 RepID=B4HYN6_DROSE|nr:ribosomal L1 domain-containing protein CG13096 [Drosophila sechellia]EDW52166.1 GM12858 [Drosophila sechellia]